MEDQQPDWKPLPFHKTRHGDLRPPMFDGDGTHGEDYATGELLSLHYAKDALLFVARFTAGPDAKEVGWESLDGQVEFLLVCRKGRYLGSLMRQNPEKFLRFSLGEEISVLDSLGQDGSALKGRHVAHFFCRSWIPNRTISPQITVSVYIMRGWFGSWKEIVVKLPKKELFVAHP